MFNPIATYRIQFNKEFTFRDLNKILPYLKELGVSTIYASPLLETAPGSMHGYDTVNPDRINPEIGTLAELKAIAKKLKMLGISWIQDIVPNHMAFHPANIWLMDVLEKGASSRYAAFFDINWSGTGNVPLMVPFLGASLEETLSKGELELVGKEGKFYLKYFESEWPVNEKVTSLDMPLDEVLALQYYRLCHHQETDSRINYRRFFTVNSLICMNMQHEDTFQAYHQFIALLVRQGVFQGLRIDHIDGLYHPEEYLVRLRNLVGSDTYIVVEKILEEGEELPLLWPVQGNTGYDFLSDVNNLFTDAGARKEFTKYYQRLTDDHTDVHQQILTKKEAILEDYMGGELDNLMQLFLSLNLIRGKNIPSLHPGQLKKAIAAFLVYCPVYRYYGSSIPLKGEERDHIKHILRKVGQEKDLLPVAALLEKIWLEESREEDDDYRKRAAVFYLRCMQFSGPLMAKGVEDTLMYTYNRFLGHNDVGDSPDAFGMRKADFHDKMLRRQHHWPYSLNATSTHDTKRGEDVRARLNVLTDIADEWTKAVTEWRVVNAVLPHIPDANDEYFIYQTLIGSYPMPGAEEDNYLQRVQEYLEKALREGKTNSSWADADIAYESVVKDFALSLLDKSAPFWSVFSGLHRKVADYGILNSLAQLMLKYTSPGVPDVYQGTELWDLSLVDPDNRRPVDYIQRKDLLQEMEGMDLSFQELWKDRYSGKIKLWLQHILLRQRQIHGNLFTIGTYVPLSVKGRYAKHIFAFARRFEDQWFVIAVPVGLAGMADHELEDLSFNWKDTSIILPPEAPFEWRNILDQGRGKLDNGGIAATEIFNGFPLALLHLALPGNTRSAGVLMPITALPSPYGIGDMGTEAGRFIDFLSRSRQKYWQLLPLNPIISAELWSPYSSISSFAGNSLLISPDMLAEEGLLDQAELRKLKLRVKSKIDYELTVDLKNDLLDKAYANFMTHPSGVMPQEFADFCKKESVWLDDFVLYVVLKQYHQDMPWYEWEDAFKNRQERALRKFSENYTVALDRIRWQQFIFFRQWTKLRSLAHVKGVKFYGDLPFYAGLDSADVWANRDLFSLDKEGRIIGIAGVPPDYFNAGGQRWGMPVYQWEVLKERNYEWWLQRIRKNLELYDLIRLDHFRAFYDYWEIPRDAESAVDGSWKKGPGKDFFEVLKAEFPHMPFVAEDLGDINLGVTVLRDEFELPGMKVLQFAFGEDMPVSQHIPHRYSSTNFVVYTGTHDNNTSIGWYLNDTTREERQRIEDYAGHTVTKRNVHRTLGRLAYASVAKMVILPFQDILGLDESARINVPASLNGNWQWRMKAGQPGLFEEMQLRLWTEVFNRV
ncbi:malto-oligosyltrehalose synthase [Pedobacter sp. AW31-3R]|uniref:malto-oligosyltrehalose synthase n=1 Tax=Pedobacter sp. AW31-3R TaxID=3445781 RepID=UPI003FA0F757